MSNTGGGGEDGENNRIWNRDWQFYVGVALPCLLGLLISNIMTSLLSLKKPERVTTSIECCYQNVGIATSVALTMFEGPELGEAMGVPFYYGILEAVILGAYCIWAWKANWTKAPSNAPFCHVIAMSYEVIVAERHELQAVEVSLKSSSSSLAITATESISDDGDTIFTYFKFDEYMNMNNRLAKEPSGIIDTYADETYPNETSYADESCVNETSYADDANESNVQQSNQKRPSLFKKISKRFTFGASK